MARPTADDLALLLSEGLDLCVRAKKLDEAVSVAAALGAEYNCATPAMWVQDAYDRDLAAWEDRARATLIRFMPVGALNAPPASGGRER